MKSFVMLIAAAASALFPSLTAAQTTSTPWRSIGASRNVEISSSGEVLHGNASVAVQFNKSDTRALGTITSLPADGFINSRISVSGTISASGSLRAGAMFVRVDGESGPIAFKTSGDHPIEAPIADVKVRLSIDVPPGSKRIVLGFVGSGIGVLVASDISITSPEPLEVAPNSAEDATALLDEALIAIDKYAFRAREHPYEKSRSPQNLKQAHESIRSALSALGDHHSHLLLANDIQSYNSLADDNSPRSKVEEIGTGDIVRIAIPRIINVDSRQRDEFAQKLCSDITRHSSRSTGWIVDLRGNSGGNMWPMLQGLRPLLGTSKVGELVDRDGVSEDWVIPTLIGCDFSVADRPIVVLIDRHTASAAEGVAIAFAGKEGVTIMGQSSAGQANANKSVYLRDGSILNIMSRLYKDRSGLLYSSSVITPDVPVAPASDGRDSVLEEAIHLIADHKWKAIRSGEDPRMQM